MPQLKYEASKVFFTSDLHLGHTGRKDRDSGIIKYCARPFRNIDHMQEELLARWNAKVPEDATVYILGDLALCGWPRIAEFLGQANGTKRLLKGNHDRTRTLKRLKNLALIEDYTCADGSWQHQETILVHWQEGERLRHQGIMMQHFPCATWAGLRRRVWHLHGHSHSNTPEGPYVRWDMRRLDVGVDAWDYSPVGFFELQERFKAFRDWEPGGDSE